MCECALHCPLVLSVSSDLNISSPGLSSISKFHVNGRLFFVITDVNTAVG